MSKENKSQIKLTADEFRYIALLHELTGVFVRDCIVDEENNRLIFLVDPSSLGKAIGFKGGNIQKIRKILNKDVEIVGYSDKLEEQVRYALAPAKVKDVRLIERPGGKKVVYVTVDPNDKGIAIGKNGRNVEKATLILRRYFGVDSVIIV